MPRPLDAQSAYPRWFRHLLSATARAFQPSGLRLVRTSNALAPKELNKFGPSSGGTVLRPPAVSALTGQCLGRADRQSRLLWPRLTSANPSGHLPMALALRQDGRPLRVRRVTFLPDTRRIYVAAIRMTLGFESIGPLAHPCDASYAVRVPRAGSLPAASFRFHLAMDTLAVRLGVPVIRVSTGTFTRPVNSRFAFAPRLTASGHDAVASCLTQQQKKPLAEAAEGLEFFRERVEALALLSTTGCPP